MENNRSTYTTEGIVPVLGMNLDKKEIDTQKGEYRYALNMTNYQNMDIIKLQVDNAFENKGRIQVYSDDTITLYITEIYGKTSNNGIDYLVCQLLDQNGSNQYIYDLIPYYSYTPTDVAIIRIKENDIKVVGFLPDFMIKSNRIVNVYSEFKQGHETIILSNYEDKVYMIEIDNDNHFTKDNQRPFKLVDYKATKIPKWVDDLNPGVKIIAGGMPVGKYRFFYRTIDKSRNAAQWIEIQGTYLLYDDVTMKGSRIDSNFKIIGDIKRITKKGFKFSFTYTEDSIQIGVLYQSAGEKHGFVTQPFNGSHYDLISFNQLEENAKEEFLIPSIKIDGAKAFTFYENRLILGNIKSKQKYFRDLQKLATSFILNVIDKDYDVRDIEREKLVSLVPGEVYSFAVQFKFPGEEWSPAFHIPAADNETYSVFTSAFDKYPNDQYSFGQYAGQNVRFHKIKPVTGTNYLNTTFNTVTRKYLFVGVSTFDYDLYNELRERYGIERFRLVVSRKNENTSRVKTFFFGDKVFSFNGINFIMQPVSVPYEPTGINKNYVVLYFPEELTRSKIAGNAINITHRVTARMLDVDDSRNCHTERYDILGGQDSSGVFSKLIPNSIEFVYGQFFSHNGVTYSMGSTDNSYVIKDSYYLPPGKYLEDKNLFNMQIDNDVYVIELETPYTDLDTDNEGMLLYGYIYDQNFQMPELSKIEYVPLDVLNDGAESYYGYGSTFTKIRRDGSVYLGSKSSAALDIIKSVTRIAKYAFDLKFNLVGDVLSGGASFDMGSYLRDIIGIGAEVYNEFNAILGNDDTLIEELVDKACVSSSPCYSSYLEVMLYHYGSFTGYLRTVSIMDELRLSCGIDSEFYTEIYNDCKKRDQFINHKFLFYDKDRTIDTSDNDDGVKLSLRPFPVPVFKMYDQTLLDDEFQKVYYSPDYFNFDNLKDEFTNRIYWSQPYSDSDLIDYSRIIKALDFKDITDIDDNITYLEVLNHKLIVFSESFVLYYPKPVQEKASSDFDLYIGLGQFLSIGPYKFIDDRYYGFGTIYPASIIKTQSAIYYVSKDGKIIRISDKLDILSNRGIATYVEAIDNYSIENLDLSEHTTGYNGWISYYDSKSKRILFTQKDWYAETIDYSNYGINNKQDFRFIGTTISFSLLTETFISFLSIEPVTYLTGNRFIDKDLNLVEQSNLYNRFAILDINMLLKGTSTISEVIVRADTQDNLGNVIETEFFDRVQIYSNNQASPDLQTDIINVMNPFAINTARSGHIYVRRIEGDWHINLIRNMRNVNENELFILADEKYLYKIINPESLDLSKHWWQRDFIRGNFLGIRLTWDKLQARDYRPVVDIIATLINFSIK